MTLMKIFVVVISMSSLAHMYHLQGTFYSQLFQLKIKQKWLVKYDMSCKKEKQNSIAIGCKRGKQG